MALELDNFIGRVQFRGLLELVACTNLVDEGWEFSLQCQLNFRHKRFCSPPLKLHEIYDYRIIQKRYLREIEVEY